MDPRHSPLEPLNVCIYCGGIPGTHEHVPSEIFLDEPYPANLITLPACEPCNNGFSKDELYLACVLECVICGSTDPSKVRRPKVRESLANQPLLCKCIERSRIDSNDTPRWSVQPKRVARIVEKLARGHVADELSCTELHTIRQDPIRLRFSPISILKDPSTFSTATRHRNRPTLWPEVGTKALERAVSGRADHFNVVNEWVIVQAGRYRYLVTKTDNLHVLMMLSEYLACEVVWHAEQ